MQGTLAQFLNKDVDELIEENPEMAAFYKTIMIYAMDEAQKKGKKNVTFSSINLDETSGRLYFDVVYR